MASEKYAAQQRHNRATYVRFPLDLRPEVRDAFRAACKANGTTPTTEIKKFIDEYIAQNKQEDNYDAEYPTKNALNIRKSRSQKD